MLRTIEVNEPEERVKILWEDDYEGHCQGGIFVKPKENLIGRIFNLESTGARLVGLKINFDDMNIELIYVPPDVPEE